MQPQIVTIGVYGFDAGHFFQALQQAKVDTFCDLRGRRAVRGSEYAFANSERLQRRLKELGIRYLHFKELAPSEETRALQTREDHEHKIARRKREQLGQPFITSYKRECLAHFDSHAFLDRLGPETRIFALFCVERVPQACHRSLVAARLVNDLGLNVKDITPGM